ncbi:Multiphosphoryl transfer protein (Includes: Phosphoenolpyruvate-protein phosphotransferase; Phosphocarrier protein HPr; Fructose-specific phosphotransferase enzyme IIA component) [Paraburkholderia ribeironis]|uniref:phosphoenolpyruvate--protein phosphotransferase n=1 Tax=Paraburkholderia ribeironis TaxID=1247936 RepID=A0A1N7RPC7_9BURK|nr:phosphoenolpyruvate--protein phosphotransferase [Paraburkholderia ribeironis]SIT36955.1 Multiphosphoryl transfer protein (Includes: Phosphoenolpyruvate-protein phosphotransferase; Phosphocarrier protein HPr; Fructose-specific phosphotransferase enzyme IIA component) [Paraburkholderia ribeironis]
MRRVEESRLKSHSEGHIVLLAPLTGPVVPLANVPDPVFAGGMFGDGIGVDPLEGRLVAPCDGIVTHLARTHHALTLATAEGVEILLHVGIDTVELNGKGFAPMVEQGAHVRAGDVLIEFDQDRVALSAPSLVSVIAIANSDAFEIVERAPRGVLRAGETPLLVLRARDGVVADAAREASATNVMEEARQQVTLVHAGGLHARPAARARQAARGFDARVEVRYEGRKAAIESVVGLLGLGAGEGATVELLGVGPQAQAAIEAIAHELTREAHGEVEETPARQSSLAPQVVSRPVGEPLAPNTLAGVCAAPGVAVGKLVRWDDADIDPPEQASGTSAAESRLLDKAIASVDADLNTTVRDASQRGAHGEAGIFAVHRVLLEDPTLLDAARDLISLGKSAGFAWRAAIRTQIGILSNMEDALLAERAADLRDIEKRVLRSLGYTNAAARTLPEEAVLAAEEFTPSDLSSLDRSRVTALVMARGGATSHAAILARQAGIPALVAMGDALLAIAQGTQVVVNATSGRLEFAPSELDVERARSERSRLAGVREANRRTSQQAAVTADGRAIEVAANIATLDDAKAAVDNGADAVGLLRTELLFIHRAAAPTTDEHRQSYQAIVDALSGRTAIIRTLDVGADKEVDYLTLPPEPNPALGLRGIRLAQVRPDLLDDQLRGLLAVQPFGAVRILLPMVTDVGELIRIRKRIDEFARELGRTEPIEVGVMIEVPSAALLADQLAQHADFLSIGTNDLTQYTLAMDRCQADLAAQADGLHPAVLRLIAATVQGAEKHGKWVGVCGALAGDPLAMPLLVGLGVTELSVDPVSVPGIKALVRNLDYQLCHQRAQHALALESAQAVRAASREAWPLD